MKLTIKDLKDTQKYVSKRGVTQQIVTQSSKYLGLVVYPDRPSVFRVYNRKTNRKRDFELDQKQEALDYFNRL